MAITAVAPTKNTKANKPVAKSTHPTYAVMISAAINGLKERGGSSRPAILKYIMANYNIADAAKAQVSTKLAIRKMLAAENIIQVKGSFKIPKVEKAIKPKPAKPETKKPASKKPAKKDKKPDEKKPKKSATKKPSTKKPEAKKPAKKATKNPAAKKPVPKTAAKKPTAKKAAKK